MSKVSKIEHAVRSPSAEDIQAWCRVCGTGQERAAELIAELRAVEYSCKIIPGLLQTADYTTDILSAVRESRGVPVDDVAATVVERMNRQRVLREGEHRFVLLIEEAVLGYRVSNPSVMIGQLHHLIEVAALPSVVLGIIPGDADRSVQCPAESFTMFDRRQVSVELVSGYLTVKQPSEIMMYEKVFADLLAMCVLGKDARALIERAIRSLD